MWIGYVTVSDPDCSTGAWWEGAAAVRELDSLMASARIIQVWIRVGMSSPGYYLKKDGKTL